MLEFLLTTRTMPVNENNRRRQTVRERLQQQIATRQRETLSPQKLAETCETELAELLKLLNHLFDFQIQYDLPTRDVSNRRQDPDGIIRWTVVLEQLSLVFDQAENRWPAVPEQFHVGRKQMIRNNPLLDFIADGKERYTQLKIKTAQLPEDAIIRNPARLGINSAKEPLPSNNSERKARNKDRRDEGYKRSNG